MYKYYMYQIGLKIGLIWKYCCAEECVAMQKIFKNRPMFSNRALSLDFKVITAGVIFYLS